VRHSETPNTDLVFSGPQQGGHIQRVRRTPHGAAASIVDINHGPEPPPAHHDPAIIGRSLKTLFEVVHLLGRRNLSQIRRDGNGQDRDDDEGCAVVSATLK